MNDWPLLRMMSRVSLAWVTHTTAAEAGDLLALGAVDAVHGPGREPDRLDFEYVFHGHLLMHALGALIVSGDL